MLYPYTDIYIAYLHLSFLLTVLIRSFLKCKTFNFILLSKYTRRNFKHVLVHVLIFINYYLILG